MTGSMLGLAWPHKSLVAMIDMALVMQEQSRICWRSLVVVEVVVAIAVAVAVAVAVVLQIQLIVACDG